MKSFKISISISKVFLVILMSLSFHHVQGQAITRSALEDSLQRIPAFSLHKDIYFITGVPTNTEINSNTANAKYQISFKQMITRTKLPWDTYLFLTYSQKAFWDIYKESYPFEEINFNPTLGVGRAFFNKDDRLRGIGTFNFEHESNGRDSIFSRSWNRFSVKYSTSVGPKTILSVKAWLPFGYNSGNPELLDYVGLGELTASHDFIPNRLIVEMKMRKGLKWDLKGMLRTRLYYRPFKNKSKQFFMLEWFAGHAENLIDYEQFTTMIRIGYVIKTDELDLLKRKN